MIKSQLIKLDKFKLLILLSTEKNHKKMKNKIGFIVPLIFFLQIL